MDIDSGQAYIVGMHISPYEKGNIFNKDPLRVRRLLLNKKEINKLIGKVQEKGLTIIPLEIYFKGRWAKLKIALARGKKLYDKRDDAADRSARRHMERALKERNL